jgi:2-polyprenyl-3-methyl-5-hydroxy-6-metoxy-1,4-benzoquinol methylase
MNLLNKIKSHYKKGTLLKALMDLLKKRIVNYYHKRLFMISMTNLPYEPLKISGKLYDSCRNWEIRWKIIKNELLNYETSSIIDIGCAEGWFIRLAAEELKCFSLGIERNDKRLLPGELSRLYDRVENCAIIKADLTIENIIKLPLVDVILCLSVMHHIVYKQGIEYARDFIKALSEKAKKAIIFEMGTAQETKAKWSSDMPDMPEGQDNFIKDFLKSAGLVNIKIIGRSSSIYNDAERLLFVAETKSYKG